MLESCPNSRVVAFVTWYTTGYLVTRRRNRSRSSILSRPRTPLSHPAIPSDFACWTVQYPPSAARVLRNSRKPSCTYTNRLVNRSIPKRLQVQIWHGCLSRGFGWTGQEGGLLCWVWVGEAF